MENLVHPGGQDAQLREEQVVELAGLVVRVDVEHLHAVATLAIALADRRSRRRRFRGRMLNGLLDVESGRSRVSAVDTEIDLRQAGAVRTGAELSPVALSAL